MPDPSGPRSIVAERAVRYLAEAAEPVPSARLIRPLLATASADERTATRVLSAAFGDDPRLAYGARGWVLRAIEVGAPFGADEPDTALLWIDGDPTPNRPGFRLRAVAVVRRHGPRLLQAVAGEIDHDPVDLRPGVLAALAGTIPVVHAADRAIAALETWLGAPLGRHVARRRLAARRLGLPVRHDLEELCAALGLSWREGSDPAERLEALEGALDALRRPGEGLEQLARGCDPDEVDIDWGRVAFDRQFLASIPEAPGTYRFFDAEGGLLYVGKSGNLRRRVSSYFVSAAPRSSRRRAIPGRVHRIEVQPTGSELEAVLVEARAIARQKPAINVQRAVHRSRNPRSTLDAVLILEPDCGPAVLRAYLIRYGRLVGRVRLGPRGGGLRRIDRLLRTWYFEGPDNNALPDAADLDAELVARWLTRNHDRAVALDPRDLGSPEEVVDRLRWFLSRGSPFDSDGSPVLPR